MAKKQMLFKTKGMNRDLSVSAFNPEFAFENRNLRLSTNESNTMLSWVNEKGTEEFAGEGAITIDIGTYNAQYESTNSVIGLPIGTAIIDHQLIIFTTNKGVDRIYKLKYSNTEKTALEGTLLFRGALHFDASRPLETLVSYESDSIQKVYWTDGLNQPRMINIKSDINPNDTTQFDFVPELELNEEITVQKVLAGNGTFAPGVIQYAFTYFRKNGQESNIFYTTPLYYISHRDRGASPEDKVENAFRITVENPDKKFDYLRIYSIQRTSINGTPIVKRIQDLSLKDAQASGREYENYVTSINEPQLWLQGEIIPKEEMYYHENKQPFGVEFGDVECYGNDHFEYFDADGCRVSTENQNGYIWMTANKIEYNGIIAYWIFATDSIASNNLLPLTVEGEKNILKVSYTDTGTSGDSIDPTELLYKGGESIVAETMEQKDATLFLGNIQIKRDSLKDKSVVVKSNTDIISSNRTFIAEEVSKGGYHYSSQLTSYTDSSKTKSIPCAGFKTGDTYRLGVQFQHKSGKWSEPIWVKDELESNRPDYDQGDSEVTVPTFKGSIKNIDTGVALLASLNEAGYKKVRPVVVFPKLADRNIVCQGVVNSTLFTSNHKDIKKDLTAQSSWFFRASNGGNLDETTGAVSPRSRDNKTRMYLPYTSYGISESEGHTIYDPDGYSLDANASIRQVEVQGEYDPENKFQIGYDYVTLHSPDIEFDDQMTIMDYSNTNYKQIGSVEFGCTFSDIDIQTVTPTCSNDGTGFIHQSFSMRNEGQGANKSIHGIVSGLFYDDYLIEDFAEYAGENNYIRSLEKQSASAKWMVYLWNKNGSLNNDINRPADRGSRTAELRKKVISNLRYASKTNYFSTNDTLYFGVSPQVFSSDQNIILKFNTEIYRGNIDALIVPDRSDGLYFSFLGDRIVNGSSPSFIQTGYWWKTFAKSGNTDWGLYRKGPSSSPEWYRPGGIMDDPEERLLGNQFIDLVLKKEGVRIKYKSTPHIVFKQDTTEGGLKINWRKLSATVTDTSTEHILPIVELIQNPINRFGGTTTDAFKENVWLPCGEPVRLDNLTVHNEGMSNEYQSVDFEYNYGDTYFQRWDCLKTYANTPEDTNQVVEIGSFMLETHTNIDGRYDRNRGQINNLNMSPKNFNLLNPIYSQVDNFFSYKIQDEDYYKDTKYYNQITWSKSKSSGADVDLWTNVTLASILELDGDKGEINKLIRFNNYLFAFQDTGIAQILYNDNVQISSTDGVPIEIANSGKVSGKDYKSDSIGCSNKWSMTSTPTGIYFIDNINKDIFLFNGQVNNISLTKGFSSWCKKKIITSESKWNPFAFDDFVAYYDKMNQEILFINNKEALAYSEKFNVFTSFYDYARIPYLCNLDDTGIWLNPIMAPRTGDITCTIHKHQVGKYCKFFGHNYPYNMTLVGNPEPQLDKIFTNIEFRACVDGEGETSNNKFTPYRPFSNLETWDEYQRGIANLTIANGKAMFNHHTSDNNASLIRKFRIWRCDIPRDNANTRDGRDAELGITRFAKHPNDRMRNPWIYIKLQKDSAPEGEWLLRTEIHDIVMTYFD